MYFIWGFFNMTVAIEAPNTQRLPFFNDDINSFYLIVNSMDYYRFMDEFFCIISKLRCELKTQWNI